MRNLRLNRKGQFSIIAAMLVAVVLVGAVITTYSSIRYSALSGEPQTLSSVDEVNLALKNILGFTVGYYGSVLQVTGNTSYAKLLASNYLSSGLDNIADIRPELSPSFNIVNLDLRTNWFSNSSYSSGNFTIQYDLGGLGIYGMTYSTSTRLDVHVLSSSNINQAQVNVSSDGEPLVNLGQTNFKFYKYIFSNATWTLVAPTSDPTTYMDGRYLINLPSGMDSSYIIQVEDTRGLMVVASSFNRITSTLAWNTTSVDQGFDFVDYANLNVTGTHSNFAAQQSVPDSAYDILTEGASGLAANNYYPLYCNLLGSTNDLQTNNGQGMTFASVATNPTTQTLFIHQEQTTIGSTTYDTLRTNAADQSGITLSKPMTNSRVLLGSAVYSLQGISSIAASTWTMSYRAWQDPTNYIPITITNSQSSATPSPFQEQITWNPSSYTSYEASDLGNIRFCSDSALATPLYAWLETCTPSLSNTATSATAWIKLPSGIAGSGQVTIYMSFLSVSTDFDGNYWGTAPNLSPTYGQYDNGAKVFNFYDNFAGTTISSAWNTAGAAGTYFVNNGLTVNSAAFPGYTFTLNNQYTGPLIIDAYQVGTWGDWIGASFSNLQSTDSSYTLTSGAVQWVYPPQGAYFSGLCIASGSTAFTPNPPSTTLQVVTLAVSSTAATEYQNYANPVTASGTISLTNYPGLVQLAYNPSDTQTTYWFRLRAYSPSNVMPSVSFGTGSFATGSVDLGSVDLVIRKNDNSTRTVLATDVANSGQLSANPTTLQGSYSFPGYNVVSQTDYLEVDYYVDVSTTCSANAYLRIDDSTLATTNQTRIDNLIILNQYTVYMCAVEFSGASDSNSWSSLTWSLIGSATNNNVNFTSQLYNYATGQYPTNGDGYNKTTIGTSALSVIGVITINPTNFRNGTTGWKIEFNATQYATPFNVTIDLANYSPQVTNYALNLQEQWVNVSASNPRQDLCIKTGTLSSTENLIVQVWHGSSWQNLMTLAPNYFNNISLTPYIDSSTLTIRFIGSNEATDPTPDSWSIDSVFIKPEPDISNLISLQESTFTVEVLQNGTMRWLGQNLQLTTQELPIPPIPVKDIHVNETINGVNQEVPFQIEDWASNYQIPLGLTGNATVFGNRQMIVFLLNNKVSDFTIWWNGSDTAVQTPNAFTNKYFTFDNTASGTLSNGKVTLQFGGFNVKSTVAGTSTSSTAYFMRINQQNSTYGAGLAYVIHHGVVRDIVQQEAEWNNGAAGCPNLYANIVLTLPANVTYYTYHLRIMFINSTQIRTITDLCPIELTTSLSSIQAQTENGTIGGFPTVQNGTGTFSNYASAGNWTAHHFSQFITNAGTQGAGIMFSDSANQNLYAFDSIAGAHTGALNVTGTSLIELLPVKLASASFTYPLDITWSGAVATFDGSTPICSMLGTTPTGLWILAEHPPTLTVTAKS